MESKELLLKLYKMFPNAGCELNYTTDFSFLCAVVLSAQTTDKKVNEVTPVLFEKYKTIDELSLAKEEDLITILKPLGLMKSKSKYLIEIAKTIKNEYNYQVPSDFNLLIKIPGVGRKTANVYLSQIHNIPRIAVDTHVNRVSYRLGLSKTFNDVIKTEHDLMNYFSKDDYIKAHHGLLFLGRYKCHSRNPHCSDCKLSDICLYRRELDDRRI